MRRFKYLPTNPNKLLMLLLGLWCVLNILQGIFTELANDEAYYWFISKDLALGYFDHPPMFGLLTWLGINTVGDSEIGIRLFTILLQPLYLYLFWTVVRTERSSWKSALIYFFTAFGILQLQLYGWVVTPDAPLLLVTALLLWSYNRYLKAENPKELNIAALLIALSCGAMAYAKYQGVLVIVFILLSNINLLRQWRIWAAAGVAALLIVPHLYWQYSHDWVSFRYHLSDRNGIFAWSDVFEYLLNLLGTFNPLIFVPFIIFMVRQKATEQMGRTLRFLSWGFMVFFLLSTFRGYVQPQWVIPIVFPILYIVTRASDRYPRFRKYLMKVGGVMVLLILAVRIFVMSYTGDTIKAEIFGNHKAYQELADTLGGRTLIFDGHYAQASKMNYYSTGSAFAYPSIYHRSSQYELMSIDDMLYGQPVAVAVNSQIRDNAPASMMDTTYQHFVAKKLVSLYYDTINYYIPTRRVEITYSGLPPTILINRPLTLNMNIYNPYSYPIPVNDIKLIAQFKKGRFEWYEVIIPWGNIKVLEPTSNTPLRCEIYVPKANTGLYKFGLTLQRRPAPSWYNSKRTEIQITNPSQKTQ